MTKTSSNRFCASEKQQRFPQTLTYASTSPATSNTVRLNRCNAVVAPFTSSHKSEHTNAIELISSFHNYSSRAIPLGRGCGGGRHGGCCLGLRSCGFYYYSRFGFSVGSGLPTSTDFRWSRDMPTEATLGSDSLASASPLRIDVAVHLEGSFTGSHDGAACSPYSRYHAAMSRNPICPYARAYPPCC